MITVGRTWDLWAVRMKTGKLWHVGGRKYVETCASSYPIVAVHVEEIVGDNYAPEVTHYGWEYIENIDGERHPSMIQVRAGEGPAGRSAGRAMMFLDMCFPGGVAERIQRGTGRVVAMRIVEKESVTP